MTAFLRRATSDLLMWLGWDSAMFRGFGLGRLTPLAHVAARIARPAPVRSLVPVGRGCAR